MADTTALKNRIRAAIKANDNQEITGPVLQQALLDMVDELNGATETEATQRQSADTTLQQNINTEVQQRQNADTTLQQNINTEVQQRQNADTTLQQNINTEVQQRQSADTTLQQNINTEVQRAQGAEQTINGKVLKLYNHQFRDLFLTGGGRFYIEETRVSGGNVYFTYTQVMQYFTQNNKTIGVGTFAQAVEAAGLTTTTSPKGRTCIEIPGGKYLVVDTSTAYLAIKALAEVAENDIILLVNVAGRIESTIDEVITDLAKSQVEDEAQRASNKENSLDTKIDTSLQTNNPQYSNGTTQVSIVSEDDDKGLNANGTLFDNIDFITCSYSVTGGNTYSITGRQPGAGSAVACAYDSNGVFIYAYTFMPSTDVVNQPITIPVNAAILKVCISGLNDNPNKRPKVYESILRVEKAEQKFFNRQFRDVFLTGTGQFFVEETRVSGGEVYFTYTQVMQYFTQNHVTVGVGTFAQAVEAAGLTTTTSPKGRTCIEIPGGKYLVLNSQAHLAIKNTADVVYTDIVLLVNVAGRVENAIDEIITDMAKNGIADEAATRAETDLNINNSINSLNNEIYSYTKSTQLSIVSEDDDKGLNADGTLFDNIDFITCSYDVIGGNTYFITGRQPGAGSAVACAYDSNGNFVTAYTYTLSTDIVDQPITIPVNAAILKVCISGLNDNPNKRPKVYNAVKASKIDAINAKADTALAAVNSVPSYWETLLTTKEASIVSKASSIGRNGDSFIFITDIHWSSFNYGVSPVLMKHILDNTSISNIFIGGDISQGGTIAELMGFVSKVKKYTDRMFATPGNHDITNTGKFYSVFGKLAENYTETNKSTDYYLDNETQKIRYIFITTQNGDNAITQDQITFLNNCVSQLTSEWTVFVITHIIWHAAVVSENPSLTTCGQSVMDAVDAASALTDATIGAIICGHLHRDWDGQTTGGIKVIGTTCDANGGQAVYDPVTPTRTRGTTTEQVFDVYNIDTSAKKIYITRIGGNGSDREFNY